MIAPGTRVELVRGPMGCMVEPDSSQFAAETAPAGSRGRYFKQHDSLPDWHVLVLAVNGEVFFCPVGERQFVTLPDA